jgi:hypothetical protein
MMAVISGLAYRYRASREAQTLERQPTDSR